MDQVRNIVRKVIKDMMSPDANIKSDIPYLESFNLMQFTNSNNTKKWIFMKYYGDNVIYVTVTQKSNESWIVEIEENLGPDDSVQAEMKWGPYPSYEEMVIDIRRKLENNLVVSSTNLNNDKKRVEDKEIEDRIKELMGKGKVLRSLKSSSLGDLKKVYNYVKNTPEGMEEDMVDNLTDLAGSYNSLINTLNKISQIDYYVKLEKFQDGV